MSNKNSLVFALAAIFVFCWHTSARAGVIVGDTEWFQPAELLGNSWNDFADICDLTDGACAGNLGGENLTGWTWATRSDVNSLINSYLSRYGVAGDDLLSGIDFYSTAPTSDVSLWLPAIYAAGFINWTDETSIVYPQITYGWLRDTTADGQIGFAGFANDPGYSHSAVSSWAPASQSSDTVAGPGAWLFRDAAAVPVPTSLSLVLLALIAWRRKTA